MYFKISASYILKNKRYFLHFSTSFLRKLYTVWVYFYAGVENINLLLPLIKAFLILNSKFFEGRILLYLFVFLQSLAH